MDDYMLFGSGYNGDVRKFESGKKEIRTVSKPKLSDIGGERISYQSTAFILFSVEILNHKDKNYYYAFDTVKPSEKEVLQAIRDFAPKSIQIF